MLVGDTRYVIRISSSKNDVQITEVGIYKRKFFKRKSKKTRFRSRKNVRFKEKKENTFLTKKTRKK